MTANSLTASEREVATTDGLPAGSSSATTVCKRDRAIYGGFVVNFAKRDDEPDGWRSGVSSFDPGIGISGSAATSLLIHVSPVIRAVGDSWVNGLRNYLVHEPSSSNAWIAGPIEHDPHPTPPTATRVRNLKERSGLTWEQLARLFSVSVRSLHLWANGGRISSRNLERLSRLEALVESLGCSDADQCRDSLLSPGLGGRSIFQQLLAPRKASKEHIDIEALLGSTDDRSPLSAEPVSSRVLGDD